MVEIVKLLQTSKCAQSLKPFLIKCHDFDIFKALTLSNNMKQHVKKLFGVQTINQLATFANLTNVRFDMFFDEPLKIFGPSIRYIKFGRGFMEKITPGVIPPNVNCIMLGNNYNKTLDDGVIPPNTRIIFY